MKKANLVNILAIFICTALCIGLEIYFHGSLPKLGISKLIRASHIPGLVYELNPNAEFIFEGMYVKIPSSSIKISSQGMRDKEYPREKPPNTKRIAMLGDSLAFGWGVEENQCFAKILENLLNARRTNDSYEVINFSVPGYNLEQELITIREKINEFNIDYVIIYMVNNDFEAPVNFRKTLFWKVFEKSYLVKKIYFSTNLLIDKIKNRFPQISENYYSVGTKRIIPLFESMLPTLKNNNIRLLLVFQNIFNNDVFPLRNLQAFCEENGVAFELLDAHVRWVPEKFEIPKDGHPNIAGHQKIAEILFYLLKKEKML